MITEDSHRPTAPSPYKDRSTYSERTTPQDWWLAEDYSGIFLNGPVRTSLMLRIGDYRDDKEWEWGERAVKCLNALEADRAELADALEALLNDPYRHTAEAARTLLARIREGEKPYPAPESVTSPMPIDVVTKGLYDALERVDKALERHREIT